MKFDMKKMFPKIFLFLVVTIVLVILIFSLNDISEIGKVLETVSWKWMIYAFGLLLLYVIINPLSLYLLGKSRTFKNVSFKDSIMIGTVEYFFNGITPFSSGGQPFQVYAYNKIGVKPSRSTGILLMNFVTFQIALVFMCLLSLIYYKDLTHGQTGLKIMVIIGLFMNTFILMLFSSLGLSKTVRSILSKIVSWFCNLKIFKGKMVKFIASFDNYCYDAQRTFKALLEEKGKFILCIIFKILSLIANYTIPFFILKALNVDVDLALIPMITAMTTFAIAMTCYIPTPGSSGGIEFAFQSLFASIAVMSESTVVSGMLLWRFLTYYILMILSFIVYLIFEKRAFSYNKEIEEDEDQK